MLAGLKRAQRRAQTTADCAAAIDDMILKTRSVLRMFSALLRIAGIEDGPRRVGLRLPTWRPSSAMSWIFMNRSPS